MTQQLLPMFGAGSWQAKYQGQPHGFGIAGARHFMFVHKRRLVEEGAVTLLRNQWHVIEPRFTEVRLQIAAEQARAVVGLAA